MNEIIKAIGVIKNGGIVIFPTDTVYGIGCRLDNKDSIKRLFKLRKRSKRKAVPVLVDSIDMAKKYLSTPLPNIVRLLMKRYWPGGVTIVWKCNLEKVPSLVRGGGNTLGVRMPDSRIAIKLIKSQNVPILASSANFPGHSPPARYEDIDSNLVKNVDFVINGICRLKQPSTILKCSRSSYSVLREGAVKLDK